jgi:MSHA biogenesis protein MshM
MYEAHFGLRELPFGLTPDTQYAYACASHQEALNTLLVAARNGEGFVKITGEVGVGKTLLCRRFLAMVEPNVVSAYVPNPYLEPRALLLALGEEIGAKLPHGESQHFLLKGLTEALVERAAAGQTVIACLDEAQALPLETLEALRLLTNLETEKRKLLQVVLFGQPELEERLALPTVRQLRQRITFQCRVNALERSEVAHYLAHRLRVAGYRGGGLFTSAAVRKMHRVSGGVPRLVNIVAHKALLLAFGEGRQQVLARDIESAAADTPSTWRPRRWRRIGLGVAFAACALAGGIGWVLLA